MKDQTTKAEDFQNDAKNWLTLFLTPSEAIHQKWGLKSFSCSAVEKKNHEQVSYFFHKTMKDGGKKSKSSDIIEILEHENQSLFYNHHDVPLKYQKPHKIHIKARNNYNENT
ncbi:hypothetical protein GLOIN_2v1772766 [Rhizophagus irregularis DAOM 181602=DAOM 197198]|uniref:Uncharacterized protein n=1 Tax=Rhizophagus irregularis (strain DAOM 181602 / DAOM 197198 / MUCL 43194) TaxID=747089 RepID=A0A2P4Q692_RHIID|nr:hypothetical protein GLOIN_2v1772766 [Rhizophagus irregularis DAOM 181602=DAOM 197198]POG73170.1 hypothetical protein GLOIN_2v1772766 [Rhizophagus irregularis DAOM 181602=DAOM 197198]|eukprot:XP_025180036.1 hypothetical protein GLOIN_2v1772766 [Rhizophagus irregularis DAOM 181602=DAOM 197198]